jgi:hypothetical protein
MITHKPRNWWVAYLDSGTEMQTKETVPLDERKLQRGEQKYNHDDDVSKKKISSHGTASAC